MQVYGPAHLHGPQAIAPPHSAAIRAPQETAAAGASPIRDEVQISDVADWSSKPSRPRYPPRPGRGDPGPTSPGHLRDARAARWGDLAAVGRDWVV